MPTSKTAWTNSGLWPAMTHAHLCAPFAAYLTAPKWNAEMWPPCTKSFAKLIVLWPATASTPHRLPPHPKATKRNNPLPDLTAILYLFAYTLQHSFLAMDRVKTKLYRIVPPKYYRFIYSILSMLLLVPIPYLPWPSGTLYQILPPLSHLFYLTQGIGFMGFLWTLRHTAMGDFLGWAHLKKPDLSTALVTTGPYRLCRHPLYFFSSLALVAQPHLTTTRFILAIWIIGYFWIGSYIEEKRLLHQFGDTYRTYQATTPRLIPFI